MSELDELRFLVKTMGSRAVPLSQVRLSRLCGFDVEPHLQVLMWLGLVRMRSSNAHKLFVLSFDLRERLHFELLEFEEVE